MRHSYPRPARLAVLTAVALLAAGCTGDDGEAPVEPPTSSPSATPQPTPPPRAAPAPTPADGVCYRLDFDDAVSPTSDAAPVRCRGPHTSETYAVGRIDNVAEGHLLAIDAEQVQDQVATTCPRRLADHVGGTPEQRRLSVLTAIWFTPSLEESADGAAWFRCDVVAPTGPDALATVRGSLAGVLDEEEGRERWALCGTAGPDDRAFSRVPCGEDHSWRAFSIRDLEPGGYPGADAVAEEGAECEAAASAVADDPLDYEWGYEGPDRAQWDAGQTYVRCWAPV